MATLQLFRLENPKYGGSQAAASAAGSRVRYDRVTQREGLVWSACRVSRARPA